MSSDYQSSFINYLASLKKDNRAGIAILRRSLGFPPGQYPAAYPYVERFVAQDKYQDDAQRCALYLVAGLYALHPMSKADSLAASFGVLRHQSKSASIESRFIALLAADPTNLSNYLRQVVSLLASAKIGLDYEGLLKDLSYWMNPYLEPTVRDRIRQRWARDFYRSLMVLEKATETNKEAASQA